MNRARKAAEVLAEALAAVIADRKGAQDETLAAFTVRLEAHVAALEALRVELGEQERKALAARWRNAANSFVHITLCAFRAAGWLGLSDQTDGPVLRVVQQALVPATGRHVLMATLITAMKSRRHRPG